MASSRGGCREIRVLNVAKRPLVAKAVSGILSKNQAGGMRVRDRRSRYNKIFEFNYTIWNQPCRCSSPPSPATSWSLSLKIVTGNGTPVTPLTITMLMFRSLSLRKVGYQKDTGGRSQRIAGEIKDFSANAWVAPKLLKRADKFMLYLLSAGIKALADGGITDDILQELDKARCGVLIGSALGGLKVFHDGIEVLQVSYKKMNPFCVPLATTNMGTANL